MPSFCSISLRSGCAGIACRTSWRRGRAAKQQAPDTLDPVANCAASRRRGGYPTACGSHCPIGRASAQLATDRRATAPACPSRTRLRCRRCRTDPRAELRCRPQRACAPAWPPSRGTDSSPPRKAAPAGCRRPRAPARPARSRRRTTDPARRAGERGARSGACWSSWRALRGACERRMHLQFCLTKRVSEPTVAKTSAVSSSSPNEMPNSFSSAATTLTTAMESNSAIPPTSALSALSCSARSLRLRLSRRILLTFASVSIFDPRHRPRCDDDSLRPGQESGDANVEHTASIWQTF